MAVILLLSGCWTLLLLSLSLSAATDLINITAASGQNVSLSCRAPNRNTVTFVEWSKYGLKKGYLLLYRDERFDPENQHPSFKNRVELQDRQMKDGDVSLILKNVTINDEGTYECGVVQSGTGSLTPLSIIYLRVVAPPGPGGGTTEDEEEENNRSMKDRLIRPVICVCVLGVFVGVVCFLSHRRHKEQSQDSNQPPAEQQQVQMLQLNHEAPAPLPSDLSSDR